MVEADLEDLLQREFREIAPLSFVKLRSPIEKYKSGYFAFLEFNIEKPSLGIYLGIREKEIVGIIFPPDYPVEHPTTLISEKFPYVQHQLVFQAPDGSLFSARTETPLFGAPGAPGGMDFLKAGAAGPAAVRSLTIQ